MEPVNHGCARVPLSQPCSPSDVGVGSIENMLANDTYLTFRGVDQKDPVFQGLSYTDPPLHHLRELLDTIWI